MAVHIMFLLVLASLNLYHVTADAVADLDDPDAWRKRMDNNGYEKRHSHHEHRHHEHQHDYEEKLADCICSLETCHSDVTDLDFELNSAKEVCPSDFSELEDMCRSLSGQGYRIVKTSCLTMCIKIVSERDDSYDHTIQTFAIAKSSCEADGGRLVVLNTLLRNALVQHAVLTNTDDSGLYLMIGGKYSDVEGEYVWLHDNSSFTFTDVGLYLKEEGSCVYLFEDSNYRWKTTMCTDHTRGYICEIAP